MARRPYRVVFTRGAPGANGAGKPGTIVKSDLDDACAEAQAIARTGGTAEVYYVGESGQRKVVATYRPSTIAQRTLRGVARFGPSAFLAGNVVQWLGRRWLGRRRRRRS